MARYGYGLGYSSMASVLGGSIPIPDIPEVTEILAGVAEIRVLSIAENISAPLTVSSGENQLTVEVA